jgi:hypothetical protein
MGPQICQAADAEGEQLMEALTGWRANRRPAEDRNIKHASMRIFLSKIIALGGYWGQWPNLSLTRAPYEDIST